ncbi:MAG: hypothetical protein COA38_09750 [Fluviicola sp.]|nr:MAG: hypothetical protein COA38_09750 [Fluviicola sp.]
MDPIAYNIISIALAIITFGIILYIGLKTDIIRESIPNLQVKDRMFSLGRFQLWIWTLVICPVFILYWGFNPLHAIDLNTTAVILLGIPAGVAVTSNVIGSSQSSELNQSDHLASQASAQNCKGNSEAHAQAVTEAASTPPDTANAASTVPAAPAPTVLKMHQVSKNFFIDLISDNNGQLSLGRLQQFIFTVVFLVIYVSTFFGTKSGELPVFGTEVFALMGISSGTYLVSKGMGS